MATERMTTLTFASTFPTPARRLWADATDFAGINDELWPVLRMTTPDGVSRLDPAQIVLGRRLFRSRLLLLGVVPVEYDDLVITEIEAGRRFLERSSMLTSRVWQHERTIEAIGDGRCTLTDRVGFVPRLAALRPVIAGLVPLLFRHRHRRLARRYASA